ncbi:alpha/beta fold hydrolase [Aliisedimentitalea scapharcae]|uniref:Alpha/beta fold hydrolase n=1 Tax=Aliisedimentitalea scapharcae TaxID=1524259 RepID=A0ABZ2XU83_9RHOB
MSDFLLIHGSCHGRWCWRFLIAALEAQGHTARAIDLPGHGDDPTPLTDVTLEMTADAILKASDPGTILLGHSWGGIPISLAAEMNPSAMRGLIYLCAYVPVAGLSMIDLRKRARRQPLMGAIVKDELGQSYTIDPDQVPALFYHDCPVDSVALALDRLTPQAIRPQDTALVSTTRWQGVPKAYIRCTKDRTIPPEYQTEMTADWPLDRVFEMQTSHSPFFADPQGLATLMGHISRGL